MYLADGTLITSSTTSTGLWSGSLRNPIDEDLSGSIHKYLAVLTGTTTSGVASSDPLGNFSSITIGDSGETNADWVHGVAIPSFLSERMYGISQVLSAVPEPSVWRWPEQRHSESRLSFGVANVGISGRGGRCGRPTGPSERHGRCGSGPRRAHKAGIRIQPTQRSTARGASRSPAGVSRSRERGKPPTSPAREKLSWHRGLKERGRRPLDQRAAFLSKGPPRVRALRMRAWAEDSLLEFANHSLLDGDKHHVFTILAY